MRYYPLKDLCTAIVDCPHSTPQWRSEGIPAVRNFNLDHGRLNLTDSWFVDEETYLRRTRRAVPEPGDIILSREAPVGAAAMIPEGMRCCLGQRLVLLKADRSRISPQYLLFALLSEQVQTQFRRADSTGSIVSNLCIPDLMEIQVPVCESGQEDIVRLLYGINRAIDLNERQRGILAHELNLIYESWFVQYDFPDSNGRPYRSSGGAMEFCGALGREIPAGWQTRELPELTSWNGGSQPPKSQHISEPQPGYVRFIQNRDYSGSGHLTYIPESPRNRLCSEMDIMVDKYGSAGQTRFGIAGAYNVALSRIDVKGRNMREYIRSCLSSAEVKRYLSSSSVASTRASLNADNLSFLTVAVPPEGLLEQYEELAQAHIRRMILLDKSSRKLETLRDRLIPQLMSGNLRFA